ncbi:glycine zipper 2TM domain-containing protein [Saccharopolyspora oryzae]|uniref:glycine zipper 2TM domain-containing protein n=1 Tax=Saccharopolyspora oryzae TaxID=2997343 RepID=UPI0038CD1497
MRERAPREPTGGWSYLPLIIGLVIGVTVATMVDQWWWATVGTVIGGVVGAVVSGKSRKNRSRDETRFSKP